MENASKALIIAGAILISILLISLGILIFNSISGTTDNADAAGDAMEIAEISARAKIILETNGIETPEELKNYIETNYGNNYPRISKEKTIELCELVKAWSIKVNGKAYDSSTIHVTRNDEEWNKVYQNQYNGKINYERMQDNEIYQLSTWALDNHNRIAITVIGF